MAMVGGKQGHAPCRIFLLQQNLFLCQFKLVKMKSFHSRGESGHPPVLRILPDLEQWCL